MTPWRSLYNRTIRTIFFKELRDILRDRRTLMVAVVLPVIINPLLFIGLAQLLVPFPPIACYAGCLTATDQLFTGMLQAANGLGEHAREQNADSGDCEQSNQHL